MGRMKNRAKRDSDDGVPFRQLLVAVVGKYAHGQLHVLVTRGKF